MFRHTSRWLALAGLVALRTRRMLIEPRQQHCPATDRRGRRRSSSDLLARIQERGTLVGYAELDYPPQSIRVENATRPATTKCQPDQLAGAEVSGYDIETSKLVAADLGVEPCLPVRRGPRSPAATGETAGISPTALARSTPTA